LYRQSSTSADLVIGTLDWNYIVRAWSKCVVSHVRMRSLAHNV